MTTPKVIRFRYIAYPTETVDVPMEQAFQFWDDCAVAQRHGVQDVHLDGYFQALCEDEEGKPFWTFAKAYIVWDFERLIWRCKRIGLGANGDGGPENPDLKGLRAEQYHATEYRAGRKQVSEWVVGVNWERRAAIYRAPTEG